MLHLFANNQNCSLFEATKALIQTQDLRGGARKTLEEFIAQIEDWKNLLNSHDHTTVASRVLEESGYLAMWEREGNVEAEGRLENLKELIRAMASFENLQAFLEHVSLVMENISNTNTQMVTVMTLHSAKGLEFETVFLAGWDEGIFPHAKSLQDGDTGLEEERRLAYVGITRAKSKLYITHASYRVVFGSMERSFPSRFISEIPKDMVEHFCERGIVYGEGPKHNFKQKESIDTASKQNSEDFSVSQRVFHVKFGYGKILRIEGDKADILFEKSGEKKVVTSFLEKTK
jgi:DNA helicase-2/ATP-dependent DNA helicase PcrA